MIEVEEKKIIAEKTKERFELEQHQNEEDGDELMQKKMELAKEHFEITTKM